MLVIAHFMRQILKSVIDVRLRLILTLIRSAMKSTNPVISSLYDDLGFSLKALLAVSVVVTFVLLLHFP